MPFPDTCPKCGARTDCEEIDTGIGVQESAPWCTDPECGGRIPDFPEQCVGKDGL